VIDRRELLVALGASAIAAPLAAQAQRPAKPARIAVLAIGSPETNGYYIELIKQRLRELGYVEGKNAVFEIRWALGKAERLPELAHELVALKPDVIVTTRDSSALVAQRATTTIPIVFASSGDPVASGLVKSLARPGGNVTGVASLAIDASPKLLELLLAVVPKLSRAAVLWNPDSVNPGWLKNLQAAAQNLSVNLLQMDVQVPAEIENAFARMTREHAEGVIVENHVSFLFERRQIAELATRHRMPSVCLIREYVEAGCLMCYGQTSVASFRLAAAYVDKILKGAKPGELPVEQPNVFELVVNLKTAKALGLTIPQSLLLRADEVIQ